MTGTPRPAPSGGASRLALGLGILLLTVWVCRFFTRPIGHDQIIFLMDANRFLHGVIPYGPGLSETNPPLMIWLSALPDALAAHLHILPATGWLRVIVLALTALSVLYSVHLLRRSGKVSTDLGIALYGLAFLAAELGITAYDSGQREHLLVLLLLPWILSVSTGVFSRLPVLQRILLGLGAAIAIWLKPHDTLILVAVELVAILQLRSLRRLWSLDVLSLLAASFLLLAAVFVFTPLYIHGTVPILVDVYWAFSTHSTSALLLGSRPFLLALVALFLVFLAVRRRLPDPWTPLAFLACSLGAFFAYALQHTDWPYHRYPQLVFFALALVSLLLNLASPLLQRLGQASLFAPTLSRLGALLCLAITGVLLLRPSLAQAGLKPPSELPIDTYLDTLPPGTTVSGLSTDVFVLSSAYRHHLQWGSRFVHLWMLPALVQNEQGQSAGGPGSSSRPFKKLSPGRTAQLAALLQSEVAEDLQHYQPAVVLVPICSPAYLCQGLPGRSLDMLPWFSASPAFRQAWAPYHKAADLEGYVVYRREP